MKMESNMFYNKFQKSLILVISWIRLFYYIFYRSFDKAFLSSSKRYHLVT